MAMIGEYIIHKSLFEKFNIDLDVTEFTSSENVYTQSRYESYALCKFNINEDCSITRVHSAGSNMFDGKGEFDVGEINFDTHAEIELTIYYDDYVVTDIKLLRYCDGSNYNSFKDIKIDKSSPEYKRGCEFYRKILGNSKIIKGLAETQLDPDVKAFTFKSKQNLNTHFSKNNYSYKSKYNVFK